MPRNNVDLQAIEKPAFSSAKAFKEAEPNSSNSFVEGYTLEQVLKIARLNESEVVIRKRFRDVVMRMNGVLGVGHAFSEGQDWRSSESHWSGVSLDEESYHGKLSSIFQSSCSRGVTLQFKHTIADCRLHVHVAPINVVGVESEVLIVLSEQNADDMHVRRTVDHVSTGVQFWKQTDAARSNDWKIASLSAIIDLTDRVESADSFEDSCHILVNELAQYVGVSTVALGWVCGGKLSLKAVSGESKLDRSSKLVQLLTQCLLESFTRERRGVWALRSPGGSEPLLMIHKAVCHQLAVQSVVTVPIKKQDGKIIGTWLFAGDESIVTSDRFSRLLDAVTPRIGTALQLAETNRGIGLRNSASKVLKSVLSSRGFLFLALISSFLGAMFIPVPYQVRAAVEAKPLWRRFVVAPFDGQIEQAFVRVGDTVTQGQVLAKLDGRQLRWQLHSTVAEKEKSIRRREVELASRNAAEALLAEQEFNRMQAEESLLQTKLEQLELKSPADGIVLSGSDERAVSASVVTGQPIFEVGPIDTVRIEIYIPSEEIGAVRVNANVRIWLEGFETKLIYGKINRIRPSSEEHLSKNVFVAEIELPNSNMDIRPGMLGTAKVECEKMALGWNLFRKPVQYLRANYTY